jgi:hypothetical protein
MTHTGLLGSAAAKALHQIFDVATANRSASFASAIILKYQPTAARHSAVSVLCDGP